MRESDLSAAIVKYLRDRGHMVVKISTLARYGTRGYPDLLVLPQDRNAIFLEVKMPGKLVTPAQRRMHTRLWKQGYRAFVVRSVEDVEELGL